MSFDEVRMPDAVAYGFVATGRFKNTRVRLPSGHGKVNREWALPLRRFVCDYQNRTATYIDALDTFFMARGGGHRPFRFWNHRDYLVTTSNGRLAATGQDSTFVAAAVGNGMPTYQLAKRYADSANSLDQPVFKPWASGNTVYRNAVGVTVGAGAGNIAISTTTGVVTFVADGTSNASAITVGATTEVILAANLGLVAGKLLYLAGFAGADAAEVNGIAHTINTITGSGPYTFTLATDTAGKTITLGSGAGHKYPQASDALIWAGNYDTPVEFESDEMPSSIIAMNVHSALDIAIAEIRLETT
jgi:uncharacterized protein (TIGR02217 family)